jgi:hypothetical protein
VADGFDDNDSVILITPCFDVTGATNGTKFSFWYHSNNQDGPGAATENEMHIDLNFNGTLIYDLIPPIIHKDNNWNFIEIDMSTLCWHLGRSFPGEQQQQLVRARHCH